MHQLQPHPAFVYGFDGLQHRRQLPFAQLAVVVLGEALEIDLHRVEHLARLLHRFHFARAAGDHGGAHAQFVGGHRSVDAVFEKDDGFGIGEGHAGAFRLRPARDILGRHPVPVHLLGARLGNVPVLATLAFQIATRGGKRIGATARQEMKEWLLLNRVNVHGTRLAPDQGEILAAAVFAHAAEAALAVLDQALLGAELALHALVGQLLPEAGRVRPRRLTRARLPGREKRQAAQRPA